MNLITITIDAGKLDRVRRCLSNCARYFQQEDMLLTAKECADSVAMLDDATKRQQAAMDEREQSDEVTHDEAMECVIGISIHPHPTFLSHKLRDYIRQQSRASLGHELTGVGE